MRTGNQVRGRDRFHAPAEVLRQRGRETRADVRGRAGAREHHADARVRERGRQKSLEPRALAVDERGDVEPDVGLLGDLARGQFAAGCFE